jgi:hypothetical protein
LISVATTVREVDFDVYEISINAVNGGGQSTKEHVRWLLVF